MSSSWIGLSWQCNEIELSKLVCNSYTGSLVQNDFYIQYQLACWYVVSLVITVKQGDCSDHSGHAIIILCCGSDSVLWGIFKACEATGKLRVLNAVIAHYLHRYSDLNFCDIRIVIGKEDWCVEIWMCYTKSISIDFLISENQ